jgi:flagellar basal body P-ring formation protein FlgA
MSPFQRFYAAALIGLLPLAAVASAQDASPAVASLVLLEEAVLAEPGLTIPADGQVRIVLPEGTPDTAVALDGFMLDAHAGLFAARLVLADGSRHGVRGQAVVTVPALVPVRRLAPGETITDADLVSADIPLASLPGAALRLSADLVGKEVQRVLLADRPVAATSVREPRAIRRGEQVLIAFSGAGIALTAPGRALQDGVLGEEIRVVNLASNRTITATAAGSGRVTVE